MYTYINETIYSTRNNCVYTPRCELMVYIMNASARPDNAMDIQSEFLFVNNMVVHLPQGEHSHSPTSFPSKATPPSPLKGTPERISPLTIHTIEVLSKLMSRFIRGVMTQLSSTSYQPEHFFFLLVEL